MNISDLIAGTIDLDPTKIAAEKKISLEDAVAYCALAKNLSSQRWRLNNLYKIVNERGRVITFHMNFAQKLMYLGLWFCNVILKSRQHGITTLACLLFLDICLFNSNTHALFIAHNKADAENIFRKKILFAYQNLPDWLTPDLPSVTESSTELSFANGSGVRVATSGRSGTYQLVHISELGKMAKSTPLKAEEVVSGTLNAVHPGQIVIIESTSEGSEGPFYDIAKISMDLRDRKVELSKLDYKFFFFAWYDNILNQLSPKGVEVPKRLKEYLDKAETDNNIRLTPEQRAWYVKKEAIQGELMWSQHPSNAEEAFHAPIEGAYYWREMVKLRQSKRLTTVPWNPSYTVDTYWDLGIGDSNAIWFSQTIGRQVCMIDYYENSGEGLGHYIDFIRSKPYRYGRHVAPHDIMQREYTSGKERLTIAVEMGIVFDVAPRTSEETQIQLCRNMLSHVMIDAENCSEGVTCLDNFRKEWNQARGTWNNKPLHDWASHGAKAFATMAIVHPLNMAGQMQSDTAQPISETPLTPTAVPSEGGWT